MSDIRAVICDLGGVLTSPLEDGFAAVYEAARIPIEAFGTALGAIYAKDGVNPLFELELGRITEAAFLAALGEQISVAVGREVSMDAFAATWFGGLKLNEPLIERVRELRERGYTIAICTNNVREWEPIWRGMLPVDELFDVVVDSSAVGVRKPDREIYELTLARLEVSASEAVLIDDVEHNCDGARELGIRAVHFRNNEQALAELESHLSQPDEPGRPWQGSTEQRVRAAHERGMTAG